MKTPHSSSRAIWAALFLGAFCHATAHGGEKPARGAGKPITVYVGTYTGGESKGIYRLELNPATGELKQLGATGGVTNPSFLAIHPSQRFLYAVGEVTDFDGGKGGGVSALSIDPKSGELTLLNQQSSIGGGPCHLVVDKLGKNVLAANYGGGSVCVLPIGEDGRLAKASSFVQHKGSSIDPKRQEAPHAALDQSRRRQPLRLRRRPGPGQGARLSLRCEARRTEAQRSAGRAGQAGFRSAAFCLPSRWPARLRDQRDELHGHRLRLRRRQGPARSNPDDRHAAPSRGAWRQHGGGAGPSHRQVPLWFEPRARQYRQLRDRRPTPAS